MPFLRRSIRQTARKTARKTSRRENAAYDKANPNQSPVVENNDDFTEKLEKLSQFRDKGLVSNDEYELKKKQILGL